MTNQSHKDAINSLTNLKIKDAFEKIDGPTNREKYKANELYVEKLIRIVHFLACNDLPVKELYLKMIKFLSDEINQPVNEQYLETCVKYDVCDSSNSCDSIIVSLNSHLKKKSPYQLLLMLLI